MNFFPANTPILEMLLLPKKSFILGAATRIGLCCSLSQMVAGLGYISHCYMLLCAIYKVKILKNGGNATLIHGILPLLPLFFGFILYPQPFKMQTFPPVSCDSFIYLYSRILYLKILKWLWPLSNLFECNAMQQGSIATVVLRNIYKNVPNPGFDIV